MKRTVATRFFLMLLAVVVTGPPVRAQDVDPPQGSLRDQVRERVGDYTLVEVQSVPASIQEGATDAITAKYLSAEGIQVTFLAYAFPSRAQAEAYLDAVSQDLQARFGYQVTEQGALGAEANPVGKYVTLVGENEAILGSLDDLFIGVSGPQGHPLQFLKSYGQGFAARR
jgi:hypothetical protein